MALAKLNYAGVDYLTVTRPDHAMFGEWEEMMMPEAIAERTAGRREHLRWLQGYYGVVGEHYFLGKGEQGTMLRISGPLANAYFSRKCLDGARCSRIDVQVTSAPPFGQDAYLHKSFVDVKTHEKARGKPPVVELNDTNYGAKMLTIGSRQSALYARVYDKHKESRDDAYEGMVRLELEVKRPQSEDLYNWLRQDEMMVFHVKHIVTQFFESRGMDMFFKDYELSEAPQTQKRHKTHATRCAWIHTQVLPTLRLLCEEGHSLEAAKALLPDGIDNATIDELAVLLKLNVGC
jgi:hypothetical protein